MTDHDSSRRRFIKTAAYVAPAILTLKVTPTFASVGSGRWMRDPNGPSQEPAGGGDSYAGGGETPAGGGDYSGGESPFSGSSSSAYGSRKKKRRWYWPFS